MGLLSQFAGGSPGDAGAKAQDTPRKGDAPRGREPVQRGGVRLWQQVFGTDKEESGRKPASRPVPGGTYGRSLSDGEASFVNLLKAMRSMAPGGWSDDRWEETVRHFVGITYVAIHRICTQLSRAEFAVFREQPEHPDGRVPVGRKDEAFDLVKLLKRPNNQDSFGKFLYRWGQQRMLTGTALTWMVPNFFKQPYELYVIPTAIAIPQPAVNPDYPDGYYRIQPVYPYGPFSSYPTPTSAVGAPIPAQWIIRSLAPHPLLRYDGYSPLTAGRLHIDEVEMIDRSRHYGMRRGMFPSGVVNFDNMEGMEPLPESEIERIRADFENNQQGPENWGRLLVSPPGAHIEPWGVPPRDMAYENGWEQLTSFILGGVFGITKPAAGMVEDASYQTLFATLKQLHLITLEPLCEELAADLTHSLAKFWGDDLIVDVRCPRIDDWELKASKLNLLMAAKAISKNEMRAECEFPLWKDDKGADMAGTESQPEGGPGVGGPPGGLEALLGGMGGAAGGAPPGPPSGMPGMPQEQTQGLPGGAGVPPEMPEPLNPEDLPQRGLGTRELEPMMGAPEEDDPVAKLMEGLARPDTPGELGRGSRGPRPGTVPGLKSLRRKYHANGVNGNGRH